MGSNVQGEPQAALTSYLAELLAEPGLDDKQALSAIKPNVLSTETGGADTCAEPEPFGSIVESQAASLPFVALKVRGISLALGKECVRTAMPCPHDFVLTGKGSQLVIGLMQYQAKTYRIADIATLVVPENRRPSGVSISLDGRWIVLLDHASCGLICDTAPTEILLDADQIHWRSAHGRRVWLAGTAPAHSCALLDVDALVQLLTCASADE